MPSTAWQHDCKSAELGEHLLHSLHALPHHSCIQRSEDARNTPPRGDKQGQSLVYLQMPHPYEGWQDSWELVPELQAPRVGRGTGGFSGLLMFMKKD